VVIIGVLAGPSVVYCFNAEGGMGQCLRGQMVSSGILPSPAVASIETAAPPATPATVTPEPEAGVAEPALDVVEPPAQAPDSLVAATFGLLRAEPDGSVVIAGSGTPGTEVQVFANDDLLGSTTVEQSGDWVFVPATPLAPGELEITLGEAGKPGRAPESIVVAINEDKTSEPLVVASTPGAPSEVLQGLDSPAEPTQLASAEPIEQPEPTGPAPTPPQPAAASAPGSAPEQSSSIAVAPEPAAPANPNKPQAAPGTDPATAPAQPLNGPAQPTPTIVPDTPPVEATANSPAASSTAAEEPQAVGTPALDSAPSAPADADATAAAPTTPTPAPAAPALDATPPTIDAIEIEGDRTFFAGAGPNGADVRLYVDDVFIADTKVSGGRWLVEAGAVLKQSSQRVRIDLLQPGTAKVAARAEVNFVVELPAQDPVAVAQAEPETPPAAPQPVAVPPAPSSAPAASPITPPPPEVLAAMPQAQEPAVPPASPTATPEPAATAPAPAAEPAAPVPTPAPPSQSASAPSVPATTPPLEAPQPEAPDTPPLAEEPLPPAQPEPEPALEPEIKPAPSAPAQTPPASSTPQTASEPATETPDIPTMVAVAVGGPDAERFASGKAIIRRGDNLWTIARRVYGEGLKYTTIYEANTGQIRDPNRIYPGQVFALPENNAN
jgi:nucleoid-associated protein YgaU